MQAATKAAAASTDRRQFQWSVQSIFRLITLLLVDPSFRADRLRLQDGDTGGADGTLNNKKTAWQNLASHFLNQHTYVENYAVANKAALAAHNWNTIAYQDYPATPPEQVGPKELEGIDTHLTDGDKAALAKKDDQDTQAYIKHVAEKLRTKWRDIKQAYTTVHTAWAASGQGDPYREIRDFFRSNNAQPTPSELVTKYLHVIVFEDATLLSFATKTIGGGHGLDPVPKSKRKRQGRACMHAAMVHTFHTETRGAGPRTAYSIPAYTSLSQLIRHAVAKI